MSSLSYLSSLHPLHVRITPLYTVVSWTLCLSGSVLASKTLEPIRSALLDPSLTDLSPGEQACTETEAGALPCGPWGWLSLYNLPPFSFQWPGCDSVFTGIFPHQSPLCCARSQGAVCVNPAPPGPEMSYTRVFSKTEAPRSGRMLRFSPVNSRSTLQGPGKCGPRLPPHAKMPSLGQQKQQLPSCLWCPKDKADNGSTKTHCG